MASTQTLLRGFILLATIAVSTALVLGFFGRLHPALDSFSHFRAHLAAALAVCAILLAVVRFRLNALAAALLAAGAFATTLPPSALHFGSAQAAQPTHDPAQPIYRLLQINLRYDNPEPNRVLSLIGQVRPDVVTLDEVSPMWAEKLTLLKAAYPYQVICNPRRFGSAILSRRPFVDDGKQPCVGGYALASATVDLGGRHVQIASLHLLWPWPFGQSPQIERLAPALSALGATAILAGDFNATTWSAAVRRVAQAGDLKLVEGVGATWIDYAFPRAMRWAGLPIDHVMTKGDVEPVSARILDEAGSDHWPVLFEFSLKPKPGDAVTAMALAPG